MENLTENSAFVRGFNYYQAKAHETSLNTTVGGDSIVYPVLGLCNEVGELAGKIKKIHRDRGGVIGPEQREALKGSNGKRLRVRHRIASGIWQKSARSSA